MNRCDLLGHRLRVVQRFDAVTCRVKCRRCGGDWGVNADLEAVVQWTQELEQLHREVWAEIIEPLDDLLVV
jgi:hypothetical protein